MPGIWTDTGGVPPQQDAWEVGDCVVQAQDPLAARGVLKRGEHGSSAWSHREVPLKMLDMFVTRLTLPLKAKIDVVCPRTHRRRSPLVSVIIPCYNYGRYLRQCVNSVLEQQDVRVDIILIDDASTDGSDQVVRQLSTQDDRIQAICHAVNRGHIATYNEGIGRVTGDYTVLLSADDLLTPGCLSRATSLMREYPSVGLTYGFPIEFTDGAIPAARTTAKSWIIWRGHDWLMQRCKAGGNTIKCPEVVMRTSVLREIGGYQPDLPHAADFALWMRAAAISDIGYVVGADQAYYRNHAQNMHNSRFDMLDDFAQRLAAFESVFSACSGLLKDADLMLSAAHQALARNALSQAIRDTAYRVLRRTALSTTILPHLRGTVGNEPTDAYAAFALKAWPDAIEFREWRALDKIINVDDGAPKLGPSLIMLIVARKLRTRLCEWRWSRTGI
jgi:glycosyltransferase involved in cell wall biosynthesis